MIVFESDNGYKKVCIWNGEIPLLIEKKSKKILNIASNKNKYQNKTICLEVKLNNLHASNYAMIGMQYTNNLHRNTNIIIYYNHESKIGFDSMVLPYKKINVGLDEEFAGAIYEYFEKFPLEKLPCGTIEIFGGYDEIGSSYKSFQIVMDILFLVFFNDNLDTKELQYKILNNL